MNTVHEQIIARSGSGDIDGALDLLLDELDDLFLAGEFEEADRTLQWVLEANPILDILIGALCFSNPAKPHLPSYATLYEHTKAWILANDPDRVEGLLLNLEPERPYYNPWI